MLVLPFTAALHLTLLLLYQSSPVRAEPVTPNDPFRAISLQVVKPPEPPICCLKPLSPTEPPEADEALLSFEDWKLKQAAKANEQNSSAKQSTASRKMNTGQSAESSHETAIADSGLAASDGTNSSPDSAEQTPYEELSPHFRVPLTDRFNYASLDCSARVHTTHSSAKSPSSILSHKKDKYMLTPCSQSNQHVVVELCEDIRIDTVQLANFEFFSGVFKDFTVKVAKTYTTDPDGWTVAGSYRAKNARGVQSFHPPTTLRDFYRYIRIDFLSHYANEYYCPISLLRVYGLTHLEQYKWDIWEAEYRSKHPLDSSPAEVEAELPIPAQIVVEETQADTPVTMGEHDLPSAAPESTLVSTSTAVENPQLPSMVSTEELPSATPATSILSANLDTHPQSNAASNKVTSKRSSKTKYSVSKDTSTSVSPQNDTRGPTTVTATPGSSTQTSDELPLTSDHSKSGVTSNMDTPESELLASSENLSSSIFMSNSSSQHIPSSQSNATYSTVAPSSSSVPVVVASSSSLAPSSGGGESIYRTIMNRLNALEANHTLYSRYMEEQTANVREALRRLAEDVGRLEGITRAQAQTFQRKIAEWERQRHHLELEQSELLSRVSILADEVTLEKRLGIAQLCLLLVVLIFVGVTRGSRGEALIQRTPIARFSSSSIRAWGQRNLSFSGDWMDRLRSSSSETKERRPSPIRSIKAEHPDGKIEFPSVSRLRSPSAVTKRDQSPSVSPSPDLTSPSRPNKAHYGNYQPTTSRPHFARSNSHGPLSPRSFSGVGPVPRSAKRWARTAHLHEVRGGTPRARTPRGAMSPEFKELENDISDVFSIGARTDAPSTPLASKEGKVRLRGNLSPRNPLAPLIQRIPSETTDDGQWIDTDVDGSEADTGLDEEFYKGGG